MKRSKLIGRDGFVKARLEEGYSFRLLSRELGVSHQNLINYVKGLDRHYRKEREGLNFRKPLTPRDLAERHNVPIMWLEIGFRKGVSKAGKWDTGG
jgi:hypothetical protein